MTGILTKFTFSKELGYRKEGESTEMALATAEALKLKGYGDYKVLPKLNTSFGKDVEDNTDYDTLVEKMQKESDARVEKLKEEFKAKAESDAEKIKKLEAELAKLKAPKEKA